MLAMLKRLGFTLIDGKSQLDLEKRASRYRDSGIYRRLRRARVALFCYPGRAPGRAARIICSRFLEIRANQIINCGSSNIVSLRKRP
jgi:hypothetical protein